MKDTDIINHHMIIRETIGYDCIAQIDEFDIPQVMKFLEIIWNYSRMKEIAKKNNIII